MEGDGRKWKEKEEEGKRRKEGVYCLLLIEKVNALSYIEWLLVK